MMPAKKAENKTKATELSVETFLNSATEGQKRTDAFALADLMQQITGFPPKMWGASIVGFGSHHYKYESGREGDMPLVSFSPRKQNTTLYLGLSHDHFDNLGGILASLGKHKMGKGCLYINALTDVDITVLSQLIQLSVERLTEKEV
jgi:hypothetical protein